MRVKLPKYRTLSHHNTSNTMNSFLIIPIYKKDQELGHRIKQDLSLDHINKQVICKTVLLKFSRKPHFPIALKGRLVSKGLIWHVEIRIIYEVHFIHSQVVFVLTMNTKSYLKHKQIGMV